MKEGVVREETSTVPPDVVVDWFLIMLLQIVVVVVVVVSTRIHILQVVTHEPEDARVVCGIRASKGIVSTTIESSIATEQAVLVIRRSLI